MAPQFKVIVNSNTLIEYDRGRPLAKHQRDYLDGLDRKMDAGFVLEGKRIEHPDLLERAEFVASALTQLLFEETTEHDPKIAALSAWLAERLPDVIALKASGSTGSFTLELVTTETGSTSGLRVNLQ